MIQSRYLPVRVPMVDPSTGMVTPQWRDHFSSGSLIRQVVSVSDAQFKQAADITILESQGPHALIRPFVTTLVIDTRAGAYTNIDVNAYLTTATNGHEHGGYLYNDPGLGITEFSTAFGTTGLRYVTLNGDYQDWNNVWGIFGYAEDATAELGSPLVLHIANALGPFTGGNPANSVLVVTLYQLLSTP